MQKYIPIIRFNLKHNYFQNGACRDIQLQVSEYCTNCLINYGLILKKEKQNQYLLLIRYSESTKELITFFEEAMNENNNLLVFKLKVLKQGFYCYTKNIPNISKNERTVYDINLTDTSSLVQQKMVNVKKLDYDSKKHFNDPNVIGTISFRPQPDLFVKTIENGSPINIELNFEAKSSYWKYVLLPRSTKEKDLTIIDSYHSVSFSDIEWTNFENGIKAGIAQSEEKIQLSEDYPYHIQLWKNFHNGKKLVLDNLSFPNPENPESFSSDLNTNSYITIYQYF